MTPRYSVHEGHNELRRVRYTKDLGLAVSAEATGGIELWDERRCAETGSLSPKENGKLEVSVAIQVGVLIVL